jgi:hypothetical protein
MKILLKQAFAAAETLAAAEQDLLVSRLLAELAAENDFDQAILAAVPTASLPSSARMRRRTWWVARGVASEVDERRRSGRHLVHEVSASSAPCG